MQAFGKQIVRSITGSMGLFLAILGIVALGCGFYAGLRMTGPDMRQFLDAYFDDAHMHDVHIASSLGLSDASLADLAAVEGVDELLPQKTADVMTNFQNEQFAMRISTTHGDADTVNKCTLTEGHWPKRAGECVISADRVMPEPVQLGSTIEVLYGTQDLADVLTCVEFTVVGLAHSPNYVSSAAMGTTQLGSGTIVQFMLVTEDSFVGNYPYTDAYIGIDAARAEFAGSDAYWAQVDGVVVRIDGMSARLAQQRLDEVKAEAQEELDDARAEYEDAKQTADAELADAQADLDEAAKQLADAQAELEDGQRQLEDGRAELANARVTTQNELANARQQLYATSDQLADGELALDTARENLASGEEQWQAGMAAYEAQAAAAPTEGQPGYEQAQETLAAAKAQLDATRTQLDATQAELATQAAQLEAGRAQLDAGWEQYNSQAATTQAQLDAAQAEIETNEQKLAAAERELADGKAEYEEGLAEYESSKTEAEQELAEALEKIEDAQAEIDDLELPDVYILDRTKNSGAESFRNDSERIDNIAAVFPFIFFLVAALVALTSMTRIVEEERVLIGTFKALGYSRAAITGKYVAYAGVASVVGAAIGIALLSQVLPFIVCNAYAIIYNVPIPPFPLPFDWPLALQSAGMGCGITLLATLAAALATLRETPATLMVPRAPTGGKRILLERVGPLWRRMSFSWKVTCRNLFRYKKRLFMTVIGIAGCTALLLTGLGLHNSIWDIIDAHYGPVLKYTLTITLDSNASEEDLADVEECLLSSADVGKYAVVHTENVQIAPAEGGNAYSTEIIVPRDSNLDSMVSLHTRQGATPLAPTDGVVISEKLANLVGAQPGGTVRLYEQDAIGNAEGEGTLAQVNGVAEYYIGNAAFLNAGTFKALFNEEPAFTTLFADATTDSAAQDALADKLHALPSVDTVTYNVETVERWRTMLGSVNIIVVVLVVSAALLAFIVLYSLTNINITERRREIASLKVLGFTSREVNAYIFREVLLLSVVGALLGLLLGIGMEGFVVVTAEVDYVMFGRAIHGLSFVLAFALTIGFTLLVMLTMIPKLRSIDMVESLKSVE